MATWSAIFINSNSGLALDLAGGVLANNTLTQQYNFHGNWNQRWRFTNIASLLNPPYYYISPDFGVSADPPTYCLDVAGGSMADDASIQLYQFNGGANQQFRLDLVSSNPTLVRIFAHHSNKCLDVENASQSQHAKVNQFTNNGGANQIWGYVQQSGLCS